MFVNLKKEILLLGWSNRPYNLYDSSNLLINGRVKPISKAQLNAIELGTAKHIDIDDPLVPKSVKNYMHQLLNEGLLVECGSDDSPADYQKFHSTSARYSNGLLWSITGKCNLNCKHCYVTAGNAKYGEISFDQCKEVIRQMKQANLFSVSIGGGEPLVRKDFWKIIDLLIDNHIAIDMIYTNGLLINDEFINQLNSRQLNMPFFKISFDGVGCHDWLRGINGTEQKTIDKIKFLKSHGYGIIINMAVHSGNAHSLIDTYKLLKSLNVNQFNLSIIHNTGNWKSQNDVHTDIKLIYDEYLNLIKFWNDDNRSLNIEFGAFFKTNPDGSFKFGYCGEHRDSYSDSDFLCRAIQIQASLLPNGKIIPCSPTTDTIIEHLAPNILDDGQSIENFLTNSPTDKFIFGSYKEHFNQSTECLNCPHKFVCRLCPVIALHNGNFFGRDPQACSFFKGNYRQKILDILNPSN